MLPESKRFPIDYVVAEPGETGRLTKAALRIQDDDPIVRLSKANGWPVEPGEGKWLVEVQIGGVLRRVQVDELGGASSGIVRFFHASDSHQARTAEECAELLRRNSQIAYAGFGLGVPGEPGRVVVTATLLKETADDAEIVAALRSVAGGGEAVRAEPLNSFDRSGYKVAASGSAIGSWEDSILAASLGGTGIAFQRNGARADTLVRLDGGRTQRVYLFFDRADPDGRQVVQMISICGPARTEHYKMALGSNSSLAFATIALARIGPEENLVVTRTQLAETADPEEILIAITTLAQIGDRLESQLTGGKDVQ